MSYRTTRTVRFDGREYPEGSSIEFGEERDDVRRELLAIEAIEIPPDETEDDRDDRRRALLGELAVLSGAGVCLVTIDGDGNVKVQDYDPTTDPLASGDPAVIRRHHLDALRDLDDMTYIGFDESAAADLGGLVLLSMDAETGLVTAVTARSAEPVGFDVARPKAITGTDVSGDVLAGTGEAVQLGDAAGGDSEPLPPVAVVPADDEALAKMTKAQLLVEAARVSATFDDGMTKPQLVDAIVAKRDVAE